MTARGAVSRAAPVILAEGGYDIPAVILAAVNADDFDAGLVQEAASFAACMAHPQREALIHIFFAQRAAGKIPGQPKDIPRLQIERGSVIKE